MYAVEPPDVVRYLAEFQLALGDLHPEQFAMFLAARNVASYVEPLEVPIGYFPEEDPNTSLAERDTERLLRMSIGQSEPSNVPADEMDVKPVRSVEDLPRIFPLQWLEEQTQPDLFYAKLARRELLMPDWQTPAPAPGAQQDESPEREVVAEESFARSGRQRAYLLLDTSSTMNDHDRRGTVARGLALAFLLKGARQQSTLMIRPFKAEAGPMLSGTGCDALRELALKVVGLPNSGQTRIQGALEQAVRDLRAGGPCLGAQVMLISDGISRLTHNPLGQEKLHSFIIADLPDEQALLDTIATLRQWSYTFQRVRKRSFAAALAPTWADCQAAEAVLDAVFARRDSLGPDEAAALARILENVRFLLREFKRAQAKKDKAQVPPEVELLERHLRYVGRELAATTAAQTAEQTTSSDAAPPWRTLGPGGRWALLTGRANPWAWLVRLVKWISQAIRRAP